MSERSVPTKPAARSADEGVIAVDGVSHALIPYGQELVDGVDLFTLPCHLCGAPPGHVHRATCTLGAGLTHRRPAKCRDCDVAIGEIHHLGCGIEQCPRCGGQYSSCDCDSSEDEPDDHEE